jgi:hypothetical protein
VRSGTIGRMRTAAWETAFEAELEAARDREVSGDSASAWRHLERAHILSQPFAMPHIRVHGRMFGLAWRARLWREVLGQLPRLVLAGPGSVFGRAPIGNTGGADVGIFTPMTIPDDLGSVLATIRH